MKIRFATLDDVPAFVALGKQFHANTRFREFDYDAERVGQKLLGLVNGGNTGKYVFLVAEDSGEKRIGWLIGCIEAHIFSAQPVASIVHYDVLPEKRMGGAALRLLTAFRKWAENRGAFELCAGVNSGVDLDRLDQFFRKLGFEATGGNYAMRLKSGTASE